jgi:hypothetical protein
MESIRRFSTLRIKSLNSSRFRYFELCTSEYNLCECVQELYSSRMLKRGSFKLVRLTVFREIGLVPPR